MVLFNGHVKHFVGRLEYGADDFLESVSTQFTQDSSAELERFDIRRGSVS